MRKIVIAILMLSLLLTVGCAQSAAPTDDGELEVISQADIPEPEPEPVWQPGTARIDGMGVLLRNLSRGEEFTVTGEQGNFYVVSTGDCKNAYIDKRFVRTAADQPFEQSRTVYTARGARLYPISRMVGAYDTLAMNTQLEVIDELHGIAMVKLDGKIGFISSEEIRSNRFSNDNGGGGGGSNGGGADGGDISLACIGSSLLRRFGAIPVAIGVSGDGAEAMTYPCAGTAFSDDTELCILITQAGQELKVTEYDEQSCTVYDGVAMGKIARWAVILDRSEQYERWTGYAKSGAKIYDTIALEGDGDKLTINSAVEVVYETDSDLYIVIYDDEIGFVPSDCISQNKSAVNNGGGGGSNGGEWTPPAL